jgi:hypothetical protein
MANLLGQNIGTNYKGILNLNTLNGNLTTTLEAITDGDGNASTLLLSTTLARVSSNLTIGGSTTASARLHVRGDGTNPVFRIESSAGNSFFIINNSGQSLFGSAGANEPYLINYNGTTTESGSGQSLRIRQRANTGATGNTLIQYWADGLFSGTTSGTAISHEFLSSGFAGAAGNSNYRNATFAYTINNSGAQTGTATGIFLNATETALNGMSHNLMDLQVGGVSRFSVANNGITSLPLLNIIGGGAVLGQFTAASNGVLRISNGAGTDFNRLQFGGTTNAFPAIKRNGAAIDFRLADDSGFCNVNMGQATFGGGNGYIGINNASSIDSALRNVRTNSGSSPLSISTGEVGVGDVTTYASAIFAIGSTTRGFLPPRGTNTQMLAIASPATGLIFYDTTNNKLNVYDGTTWQPCW